MLGAVKASVHIRNVRHEAISRFFERGLLLPEVALISGHRDHRMLLRYTHLRPENLVAKLDANPWPRRLHGCTAVWMKGKPPGWCCQRAPGCPV